MNNLSAKLPTLDEIRAEKMRRAEGRVARVEVEDIPAWFTEVLGCRRVYPKQLAMVEAVRDNEQVSVCGCHSSGKDFMAARIALWWMAYHKDGPAKVIITAPTHRQIGDIVWQELRTAYLQANLGGQLYQTPLLRWNEERFILGFSTDKPYQMQGFHSANLLVIVSEAHGMEQSHIDALWRLNPNCMLMTGNPISESGEFFDSHHGKAHLWKTINIDAWDTPNVIEGREVVPGLVTLEDIERGRRNWGEDNPLFQITFQNKWVEGMGKLVLVPLSWALAAERRTETPGGTEVVGVDVARSGRDKTVIYARRGKVARCIHEAQGNDTMRTAGVVKAYHDAHQKAHIVVDGVGVGAGVVDRCRELGLGVFDFQAGAGASSPARFANATAEVWWRMREAYEAGLDVDENAELRADVSSRTYEIQSDKRIKLESKDDLKARGRKSPDHGDALAMTFVLDYDLGRGHLSPGSDVDEDLDRGLEASDDFSKLPERESLSFGRGTDLSPWSGSRWGKIRRH